VTAGHGLLPRIAGWCAALRFEALLPEAVALVRRAVLDTLGVALLGTRQDSLRIAAGLATAEGPCSLIGLRRTTDAQGAALVNGTAAHAELYDDNSVPMIAHPSAPLVPALLALAEARGASGAEFVTAYTAGFETGVRLGRMLNPALYEAGWHVTRVLGVLGAAAGCARLLRLDAGRTAHAIGIAASMAGGLRAAFGTMTMALHAGLTARDGVQAALLAEAGFTADAEGALDGRYGFLNVFAPGGARDIGTLGAPLELIKSGIVVKPYPSGAPTLAAVAAALALRPRLGDAMPEAITCLVHAWNFMTLREEPPRTPLQAKVSLRYCVAAALRHGRLTHHEFTEDTLRDDALTALMNRIAIRAGEDLPDNGQFPAELHITLPDGTVLTERCEIHPGGIGRPLGDAELEAKFLTCAENVLTPTKARALRDQIATLDRLPDLHGLGAALRGETHA
jgi:2-methylcitrate dehydratase PrpD